MKTTIISLQTKHVGNDNNNQPQMMTSLEIAELTGKQHKHLMRDIRNMEIAWEKVNGSKFGLVEYKDKKGEFRFRLKAKNGQIIATGEGYAKLDGCLKGVASVQKNAKDGKIADK